MAGSNLNARTDGGGCPLHNLDWATIAPRPEIIAALISIVWVALYVILYGWARRNRPGPKCWPLIGCVPTLLSNWHRLHDFLLDCFQKDKVFWLTFGFGQDNLCTADPVHVEHILKTNFANYPKGRVVAEPMKDLLGKGIFTSDHETWRQQRKVASLEFSSGHLRDFGTVVYRELALTLVQIVSTFAEAQKSMDMQDLFMRMTLDSTCKKGFGVELGCLVLSLPEITFAKAFDRANEISFNRWVDPLWRLKRALNIGSEKELRQCVNDIDKFSYDVIKKRRAEMEEVSGRNGKQEKTRPDLLSRFMKLTDELDQYYSDQALRDHVVNFIIAGRDTSAIALSWLIYMLCVHPKAADRIFDEIKILEKENENIIAEGKTTDQYANFAKVLSFQNIAKLQYLHAALSETLRLFPSVPLDSKTCSADDVLPDGTLVRKNDVVTYCAYPMGRLERVWGPDASEFKPERWLQDGTFQPESPFKFVSFHAGYRGCLGKDTAYLQMKITAALLIRFFRFQLVPGHEVSPRIMFVLSMTNGLKVTASRR